jgi:hypothetical protein
VPTCAGEEFRELENRLIEAELSMNALDGM